jgi:hypothetical protein
MDGFAAIRAIWERSVPALSLIPLLFALLIGFHQATRQYLARLLGVGGKASPTSDDAGRPTSATTD